MLPPHRTQGRIQPMSETVVYRARSIVTMDPNRPKATHVAVRDGWILAVGGADCAEPWGGGRADDSFAESVLMPGFVEGHAHLMAGGMWRFAYVGYHDRVDPDGKLWKGVTDIDAMIGTLRETAAKLGPDEALVAWGFDPIFLPSERVNRRHLDAVSADRPIMVMHSNFHLLTANSPALAFAGYTRETNVEGVVMDADGPSGELQEMAAMFPVMRRLGVDFRALGRTAEAVAAYGRTAQRVGVTTCTDLFSTMEAEDLPGLLSATGADDFPVRLVPALGGVGAPPEQVVEKALSLRARSTDKLRMGAVKLMTDGSIQGYTARLKWPGYVTGHANGIWNTPPEQLDALCEAVHAAGLQMNIHVNGDEASEAAIDSLEKAIAKHPRPDHRHILQHGQMIGADQFRRMAALGICANLFANHIWYFGDQHAALTIGEDRAARMDACRSCLDAGVPLAIHSDAPVTPMGPLTVAWCAVNRLTGSRRVLGEAQRISVMEALHAITLGVAHQLKLDREIGSIEAGKRADFAVLADDPTEIAPEALRDIEVRGTVFGGRPFLL
jgi:predicted amidohydrolase YtcJ